MLVPLHGQAAIAGSDISARMNGSEGAAETKGWLCVPLNWESMWVAGWPANSTDFLRPHGTELSCVSIKKNRLNPIDNELRAN